MKVVVTLPTYNERLNIESLLDALLQATADLQVLVIDDNSPDGTWQYVASRAESDPKVQLLHRTTQRGRGTAGIAGFQRALELGADAVVEMDADWSHHPRFLPGMIEAIAEADLVIGSRLVPGGGEQGRGSFRRITTNLANRYIRLLLGLPYLDCTSGYRVYRRWVLESIAWEKVEATGPALLQEVLLTAHKLGAKIVEIPILFEERRAGHSTLTAKILAAGLLAPWRLRARPAPVRTT